MKILVAYDGSQQATRALDWAGRVSPGSSVTVISVAPALEASGGIADAIDPSSDVGAHRGQLEEAITFLSGSGISAETILKAGNPAEEIIIAATDGGFDMILVGNHGMGAVRRFLIGSVADRVVRHATVPVLVVR
ncbi:MAG: universal stress protein [Chloroflexota bacterium]